MQQMKLKWLLREVSAHINHATLRAAVFGSGCASAVLALGAGGGGGMPLVASCWEGTRLSALLPPSRGEPEPPRPFVPSYVRAQMKSLH